MKAAAPAFISHTPQRRLVWEPPTWDSLAIVVMSSPPHIAITLPDSRACWPIAFRPACNNFAPSHVCATRSTPRVGTVMRAPVHDQTPRNSFQVLAREHLPCLYGLARRLTRHDPEDLVQDALLRGYRLTRSTAPWTEWLRSVRSPRAGRHGPIRGTRLPSGQRGSRVGRAHGPRRRRTRSTGRGSRRRLSGPCVRPVACGSAR